MHIEQLKKMFLEMVVQKNASLIPHYYHEEFLLYANEQIMNYNTFLELHRKLYATPIQYQLEYDEETFLEQGDKVAGRIWITTKRPEEPATRIEVVLIAQFKDNKVYRIWELTFPDYSKLPAFKEK